MSENSAVADTFPTGSHPPDAAEHDPRRWYALV